MGGVHKQKLEVVLEQEVDRLPIDAGGLHRHMGYAETLKPVAQREQLGGHRRELGAQLGAVALPVGDMDAGSHLSLVDIERATALKDAFHLGPPLGSTVECRPWEPFAQRFWSACSWQQFGVPWAPGPYC